MTTRKITTFLMCPTSTPADARGTPHAGGDAGGHIRKGAWVHVHAALLVGLAHLAAQHLDEGVDQNDGHSRDEKEPGAQGHGSGLNRTRRSCAKGMDGLVGQAQIDAVMHEADECARIAVVQIAHRQRCAVEAVELFDQLSSADGVVQACLKGGVGVCDGKAEADGRVHGSRPYLVGGEFGMPAPRRGGRREVNAHQLLALGNAQEHHSRGWDAIALPVAHAGHGNIEETSHLSGAAKSFDYLGRMGVHAPILAPANIKSKPRRTSFSLG